MRHTEGNQGRPRGDVSGKALPQVIGLEHASSYHAPMMPTATDSFCVVAVSKGALLAQNESKAPPLTQSGR